MTLEANDSEPTFITKPTTPPGAEWPEKLAIERIEAISQNARATWFGLLGLLAFVMVTLLGVQDIDFFGYGRETQLPLIGVSVPTVTFFIAAPVLTAAIYAYFHFYLMKLWDAVGRAPARISTTQPGQKRPRRKTYDALGDRIHPWLVSDAALLLRRKEGAAPKRALSLISALTSGLLTWGFGWVVLGFAWWRSLPAHYEWLSLGILACFVFSLWVGLTSLIIVLRRVGQRRFEDGSHIVWRKWWVWASAWAVVLAGVSFTWAKTEGGFESYAIMYSDWRISEVALKRELTWDKQDRHDAAIPKWLTTWRGGEDDLNTKYVDESIQARGDFVTAANLLEAQLTEKPADWADHEFAETKFRRQWCTRRNLTWAFCAKEPDGRQKAIRNNWCEESALIETQRLTKSACAKHFAVYEESFQDEWLVRRADYLSILKKPNLEGRDLRNANLNNSFLPNVDLEGARLEGAKLRNARLEGANLRSARLEGAFLRDARLEGADLTGARLEEAYLIDARLEGANLSWARFRGADLRSAHLERANLHWARLEGANLSYASLEGANLYNAQLEGADLRGVRFEGALLSLVHLEQANLRGVRLEGAKLFRAQLDGADLSKVRLQRANLTSAQLDRADLSEAQLKGANLLHASLENANLFRADLQGADLRGTNFQSAELSGARIGRSPLNAANFTGATGLTQESLDLTIGDRATILPRVDGKPLFVWSCWEFPPDTFDQLLSWYPPRFHEYLKGEWLCDRHERVKTGQTSIP